MPCFQRKKMSWCKTSLVVLIRWFSYDWNLHSIDIESRRVDNPNPSIAHIVSLSRSNDSSSLKSSDLHQRFIKVCTALLTRKNVKFWWKIIMLSKNRNSIYLFVGAFIKYYCAFSPYSHPFPLVRFLRKLLIAVVFSIRNLSCIWTDCGIMKAECFFPRYENCW